MRIRSIKPEFWRSRDVTQLDLEDRLLFIGLWSYVDDNGVGRDEESGVIADLFADDMFRDPRETVARVSRGLSKLSEAGLITRYTVDGRPFLHINKWSAHQRIDKPAKERFPRPDADSAILATPSRDPRDIPATGAGEQGNRGAEEQRNSDDASRRATQLPRDWEPTDEHRTRASTTGLDPDREAEKFRAHAAEKGRTAKSWNSAFTRWLIQAAEYATRDRQRPGGRPTTDRQGQILRDELARAQAADAARANQQPTLEIAR